MLSSFIIVFREVLEAALVIGIVASAVKGLPYRGRWISTGVILGVLGAVLVAAGIGTISNLAQGNGQELFSASVLLIAGMMLAWHNIWMAQHSREMTNRLKTVGADVITGSETRLMLVMVTALAVLREGSETALFLYGIVAGGSAQLDWVGGSLLGLATGAGLGILLFVSLSRIPVKRLFQLSSWLILFMSAGMLARGVQFLVQGGFLSGLVSPIWNTSGFISGNSLLGRSLAALLGYVPAPSLTQFLVYIISLIAIGSFMMVKQYKWSLRPALGFIMVTVLSGVVFGISRIAEAADYQVYSPNVVKGEKELELRGFNSWGTHAGSGTKEAVRFAAGFAPTDFWATELYVNYEKKPGESLKVEEYEWENRFQLTPQGKYWVDVGLLTELEVPSGSRDPYEFKIGPIFAKDFGPLTAQINLLAAHQYGTNAQSGIELSYRSRLLFRYHRLFSPLLEAYGQPVGKIGSWGVPKHQVGGGFTGKVSIGSGENIRYSSVLLWGVSRNTAEVTGVVRLEYEFF